jgi:uncharacterized protein
VDSPEFSAVVQRVVTDDARAGRLAFPSGDASENLIVFCETLRLEHEFKIGPGEITDALRALEAVGVHDVTRVQAGLRAVCCARLEDVEVFDWAFREFFLPAPQGTPQDAQEPLDDQKPRRANDQRSDDAEKESDEKVQAEESEDQDENGFDGEAAQQRPDDTDEQAESREGVTRALFSAHESEMDEARIEKDGLEAMLKAAGAFMAQLRLGRSRAWRIAPKGQRFDVRRTMRQSLSTGGDPMRVRWLAHPRRNPRVVLLIDGSRSMTPHTAGVLQFAYSLSQRSRRVDAFTFSTALQEITPDLQRLARDARASQAQSRGLEPLESRLGFALRDLRQSWGGGTRIGESLRDFVRDHGTRTLTRDTLVIIASDGLDVGETDALEFSMREIKRRSAGVIWLNPLAAHPNYQPTARGMRVALPYIRALTHANTPDSFAALANALKRV